MGIVAQREPNIVVATQGRVRIRLAQRGTLDRATGAYVFGLTGIRIPMKTTNHEGSSLRKVLHSFSDSAQAEHQCEESDGAIAKSGLKVPVSFDLEKKREAMARIRRTLFVSDADQHFFNGAQHWIEECGRQVELPTNFCGGLLLMRLYRLLASPSQQTEEWITSVHDAAAAYDFAFLALSHADDEVDTTLARDGKPTRFVTHPDTRAVDGINLLLSGMTAMQRVIGSWPQATENKEFLSRGGHPLTSEITEELLRALREASFPIILERTITGSNSAHAGPQVDAESLDRVEALTRHRAHTYFMRATRLATLLAGFAEIEPDLLATVDEVFRLLGLLGAGADDLQDIFVDFAVGTHSICTVMAELCVAEDEEIRPTFRRDVPSETIRSQRECLRQYFGTPVEEINRSAFVSLLDEIELREALTEYFEGHARLFAAVMYKAVTEFGFSADLLSELVVVVCRDPDFALPDTYVTILNDIKDEDTLNFINDQIGKFITEYFLDRFWPANE